MYREGMLSAYWLGPVTTPKFQADDATGLSAGIYWIAWAYFTADDRLVWC